MDFQTIKNKLIETKNKAIDYSAEKLSNSMFTIQNKKELDKIILKSKTTSFTNIETGITKEYLKKVYILFGDDKSDFFKEALIMFPILATKAFSQNITMKLANSNMPDLNLEEYNIKTIPSLLIFEDEKVINTIEGRENILKLVKSLKLDINSDIEKFKK
ncbi:MAG: hypothetical protein PHV23_03990 [Candidatus Gracilibacteria bacterium]|nr:hypothetical protein [Candidatus Gracilibacteria bacterium]